MFPLTMRYRTLAFLTATPAFASILYVTSTLDFTTKPLFLKLWSLVDFDLEICLQPEYLSLWFQVDKIPL